MTSERLHRRIEALLDEADEAVTQDDWPLVANKARAILAIEPENGDAQGYLKMAEANIGSTQSPSSQASQSLPKTSLAPPVPTSFANGRYTVERLLGEGGKKKVYLAHDSLLDRDVAFALLKTEGLDDAGRVRVQREAQAMGRLGNHPNIVTVYDIGDEAGQPYLVLPILSGGDVEGVIEKAPERKLPLDQAIRIAIETCQGLELAHNKGIVHRDLKPGNVWLTEDGRAMIGDFGLAVAADRSRLTQAGMMVGTVSYMPPEQAMGGEVGPRSDLYSLGAMLYEMVCGRPPFVGDESVAIIGQHLNTPPVAPTWHRPDCPPALEALLLRLLEKDPAKRPASATEVREALASVSTGPRPVTVVEPTPSGGNDPLYRRTFVGRENEVKQLQAAFDSAMSGNGGLVMVIGEPGIGKTSICEQLTTYAAMRGGRSLAGHCYEEGSLSLPYLPFVEAMRSYVLERDPEGLRSDLGTGAADVARIVSEVRDRLNVEPPPKGDPEDDRWRLLQAVTTFLANASRVQPLVLVLEDLHWADRGTLDLLLHVARNTQNARLLIVGNYRDVEVDRSHPLSSALADLRRLNAFQSVRLRGLSIDEVQRMMGNIRGQPVPLSRAELIHRQTEGNPLFVQEVLRYLVEEGLVVRQDGRYGMADADAPEPGIPEGLRDVVGKRLSRLSQECNRILAVAAVIGRDFNLATLRTVTSVEEEELVSALEEAVHIGVLEERSRPGQVSYRFAHAFFRQTLYEEMIAPRRLRLHQEVARALEQQYGSRKDEHAAELAEHFSQSTDPADLAKAIEYGGIAANRAMSVFAYTEAASHLERCLGVLEVFNPDDKRQRCDLLLDEGEALLASGELLRALDPVAESAFALAEDLNDAYRAIRACRLARLAANSYGFGLINLPILQRQLWIERADQWARDGTSDRVFADMGLASLNLINFANVQLGQSYVQRALKVAMESGDAESLADAAYQVLSGAFTTPENYEMRKRLADEIAAKGLEADERFHQFGSGSGIGALAETFFTWGDRKKAEEIWTRRKERAGTSRDARYAVRPSSIAAFEQTIDGQLEAAIESAQEILAKTAELGSPGGPSYLAQATQRALLYLGRSDEALVGMPEDTISFFENGGLFCQRAACLAHSGRLAEARDLIGQFRAKYDLADSNDGTPAGLQRFMLEAAILVGDSESAAVLVHRMAPLTRFVLVEWNIASCIGRLVGDAEVMLGQLDRARIHYSFGLEACEKVRFRPEIALTRLSLAELLLEHYPDERDAAIDHLDFAITELRDMKMQPALERALRHRGILKA